MARLNRSGLKLHRLSLPANIFSGNSKTEFTPSEDRHAYRDRSFYYQDGSLVPDRFCCYFNGCT